MNNLSSYLQKFKNLVGDKSTEKRLLQEIIAYTAHIPVSLDSLVIREGVVTFLVSPIEKTEILLHKKQILSLCKERNLLIIDLH